MVQCHLATVGNHTVDKLQFFRFQSEGGVAAVQNLPFLFRQFGYQLVEQIEFVQGDDRIAPSGGTEVFGE
mgnify:FL=1